jgi:Flp pilus assembly protein TadD
MRQMRQFERRAHSVRILTLVLMLLVSASGGICAGTYAEEICDLNADQALARENYAVAIALHQQFIRAHKNNALAHYHLGFAYGMTGRRADEITEYLAATKLGLEKWDLFVNLGLAYLDRKDWTNAISALQSAVLLGPAHAQAHFNLAIAYERDKDLTKALQEINASLALTPTDPDAHNTKAIIFAEQGDLVHARCEWARLIQIAPGYAAARVNLAILNGSHMPEASTSASRDLDRNRFAFAR